MQISGHVFEDFAGPPTSFDSYGFNAPTSKRGSSPQFSQTHSNLDIKLLEQEKVSLATLKNQKTSKRSSTRPEPKIVKPEKPARDIAEISSAKFSSLTAAREQASTKTKVSNLLVRELSGSVIGSTTAITQSAAESKKEKEVEEDKSVYFVDHTAADIRFVELLQARRSEELGKPESRVIYWKKSKAFILEDQQLFKITLKDFKKSRYGVDLSRVQLDKLKDYMAIITLGSLI